MTGFVNRRVLVVDDEQPIRDVVRAYLEKDGYHVFEAENGKHALEVANKMKPAVVVLDLMLPDLSGEDVCRELRRGSDIGIIMLTAKGAEEQRIAGLSLGADDYIVKPFSPRELVARVRALVRRLSPGEEGLADRFSFEDGALVIDAARHEVTLHGEPVGLTTSEFKLLLSLARHPGRVYSRLELIEKVQGYDFEGYERTIDAHVKNLRHKLGDDPRQPRFIVTVYGAGYKFGGKPDA